MAAPRHPRPPSASHASAREADTPDAVTPDADTPDAVTPDADTPDAVTPDADTPDAARSDRFAGAEILRLEGVRYSYPDGTEALRGIDLRLRARERVALLGPNGSGKTTVVLHLLGILRPAAGRVRVLGWDIQDGGAEAVRGRLGVLFQDPRDQLFLGRVRDDVAFGPANQGVRGGALDRRVAEALAAVGLRDVGERASSHLSSGEQRRAALAAVLAMRPEALVLDEPTANLDPSARRALARLLAGLGLPLLVVTHDLPFALELCPRAVLLDAGAVVARGATTALLADRAGMRSHGMELPYGFHPERA